MLGWRNSGFKPPILYWEGTRNGFPDLFSNPAFNPTPTDAYGANMYPRAYTPQLGFQPAYYNPNIMSINNDKVVGNNGIYTRRAVVYDKANGNVVCRSNTVSIQMKGSSTTGGALAACVLEFGGSTPINKGIILPHISGNLTVSNYANDNFYLGFKGVTADDRFYASLKVISTDGSIIQGADLGSFSVKLLLLDATGSNMLYPPEKNYLPVNNDRGYLGQLPVNQNMKIQGMVSNAAGYHCSTQIVDFSFQ